MNNLETVYTNDTASLRASANETAAKTERAEKHNIAFLALKNMVLEDGMSPELASNLVLHRFGLEHGFFRNGELEYAEVSADAQLKNIGPQSSTARNYKTEYKNFGLLTPAQVKLLENPCHLRKCKDGEIWDKKTEDAKKEAAKSAKDREVREAIEEECKGRPMGRDDVLQLVEGLLESDPDFSSDLLAILMINGDVIESDIAV